MSNAGRAALIRGLTRLGLGFAQSSSLFIALTRCCAGPHVVGFVREFEAAQPRRKPTDRPAEQGDSARASRSGRLLQTVRGALGLERPVGLLVVYVPWSLTARRSVRGSVLVLPMRGAPTGNSTSLRRLPSSTATGSAVRRRRDVAFPGTITEQPPLPSLLPTTKISRTNKW